MCAYIQANTNGRLHDATEPSISPLNRGFLYGDAVYEVWRTYEGVIFAWEEHWERLHSSARALHLDLPFSAESILADIRRTVDAYRAKTRSVSDIYIRLQVSRGEGAIGLDTAFADHITVVLLVQDNKLYTSEKFDAGLQLSVAQQLKRNTPDALDPAWKTGNYLNNILCLREARARGADEVVICNQRGEVTEAAVSNIGFIRHGQVITPPLGAGILAGITRQTLLHHVAPALGVAVSQETLMPADFSLFDECFLLSTTKDVTPVSRIDDCRFKIGGNTITMTLKRGFSSFVQQYIQTHPELRLFG